MNRVKSSWLQLNNKHLYGSTIFGSGSAVFNIFIATFFLTNGTYI